MYDIYIAGGISGIIEIMVTHPLDYIKTKKQQYVQKNNPFTLTLSRNYYSGITPRLFGIIPMRMLYWSTQNNVSNYLRDHNTISRIVLTGLIVGSTQTVIDNPIEIIKTRLISQQPISLQVICQNKGFMATCYRNSIFASCVSLNFNKTFEHDTDKLLTSACTGLIGSVISQPFDYIKTHQQYSNVNKNMMSYFKLPIKTLFIGVSHRASIGCISMGIGYTVYDKIHNCIANTYV